MNFDVYGPFMLPRTRARLIDNSRPARNAFWAMINDEEPGLRKACGVYVYCLSARRGIVPWYVGLTEKRSFDVEADHHAKLYDRALETPGGKIKNGERPCLFLLPFHTNEWKFRKPSKNGHAPVQFLETYLIGLGLERNRKLLNTRKTKFLKTLYVPGFLNARGQPTNEARKLKEAFGV